jgi:hypothetical protein
MKYRHIEHQQNNTNWKTKLVAEKPVPVSLCSPQVSRGLAWNQAKLFIQRGQSLIAQAIGQPYQIQCQNTSNQATRKEKNMLNI